MKTLALGIAVASCVFASCARQGAADAGAAGPPGELVSIGSHRLDVVVKGSGQPVVVFEAGWGVDHTYFGTVLNAVSQMTTTVAYSRAGHGRSEAGPLPRTHGRLNDELRQLLQAVGLQPPYVLVGHSFGGVLVRLYASTHPDEVAGLVLIDAQHERQYVEWARIAPPTFFDDLWASYQAERGKLPSAAFDELDEDWKSQKSGVVPGLGPLRDMPTVVLTALKPDPPWFGNTPAGLEVWRRLHSETFLAASDGAHIVTSRSGHFIHVDEPELVIGAIRRVVDLVRTRSISRHDN